MQLRSTLCAISMCTGCSTQVHSQFDELDRKSISDTLEQQAQAWNRNDLAAFMDSYAQTPELFFTSGGKIRRGWQATMDGFKNRYAQGDRSSMGNLIFTLDEIKLLSQNAAFVIGHFELRETPEAGKGVFTLVLQRKADGPWKITHDHTSVLDEGKQERSNAVRIDKQP